VGITRDGIEIFQDLEMEDIGESDAYGLTVIDSIMRGGQCHFQLNSLEYIAGALAAFWPVGGTLAGNGVLGRLVNPGAGNTPIGILASDLAKALVMTSTAGTPSAAAPATLTSSKVLLAKNNNGRLLFNSKLREVPIRLRAYPTEAAGVVTFFSTT